MWKGSFMILNPPQSLFIKLKLKRCKKEIAIRFPLTL
jgi:hypothetical protein